MIIPFFIFTGLVQDVGMITGIEQTAEGKKVTVSTPSLAPKIKPGDSVAVNGVCLTATQIHDSTFTVQTVHVTLEKSNLGSLHQGSPVNLELSLQAADRFGGHVVQGHVNGIGTITSITQRGAGDNYDIAVNVPEKLRKYMIREGAVALDGISLTIAALNEDHIVVSIIPYTWMHTNLSNKQPGDTVNIEVDLFAQYVERIIQAQINQLQQSPTQQP